MSRHPSGVRSCSSTTLGGGVDPVSRPPKNRKRACGRDTTPSQMLGLTSSCTITELVPSLIVSTRLGPSGAITTPATRTAEWM